jgi:lantibiotic modifying enzyme
MKKMNNWKFLTKDVQKQLEIIIDALDNRKSKDYSLLGGNTGTALLFYYYWLYTKEDEYLEKGNKIILENFDKIKTLNNNMFSLCNGISGFLWAVDHLINNGFIEGNSDELFEEYDTVIYSIMQSEINKGNYDFLHQASGMGLYFLARNTPQTRNYVESLICGLEKTAEIDDNGLKWRSFYHTSDNSGEEVYNLSLSHGIASIIALLGKAYQQNIAKEKTKDMLCRAITFLLSKKSDIPNEITKSFFPSVVYMNENKKEYGSRLAWCYGDLGIGMALWQSSRSLQHKEWERISLDILLHTTTRTDLVKERVADGGICHGSSGIAHIYIIVYIKLPKSVHLKMQQFTGYRILLLKQNLLMELQVTKHGILLNMEDGLRIPACWKAYPGLD